MLKKALIPLSLKEPHFKLTDMAAYINQFGTETVCLCHIAESTYSESERLRTEESLHAVTEIFQEKGITAETVIERGEIASEVCRQAHQQGADYISIPWKKKNFIKRSILTSPDIDILRICSFPTLIFKSRGYLGARSVLDTMVYATDCKEADKKVLPYLKSVPFGAETLYFLHVRDRAPDPETDKKRQEHLLQKIAKLEDACRGRFQNIETILAIGSIKNRITRKSRKFEADLVVIGRNEKKKPMDKLLGSTAESLPHRVNCSVLIIT